MANKTKSNLIALFSILLFTNVYGQKKNNYSGSFTINNLSGKATYSYFDDESYERIYDGAFSFTTTSYVEYEGKCTVNCNGNFIKNKAEGIWIYVLSNAEGKNIKSIMSFKNGLKTGVWTTIKTDQINKFKITEKYVTEFHLDTLKSIEYSFQRNGKLIKDGKIKFNNEGCLDGEIITRNMNKDELISIWKIDNCILKLHIEKNNSTGEVLLRGEKADRTSYFNDLSDSFSPNSILKEMLSYWRTYINGEFYTCFNPMNNYFPLSKIYCKDLMDGRVLFK